MKSRYFSKSLRLLAHPLSLAAIGLMLANDAIFKGLWPSWWTGKLSDFAGLFFLPFLAAAMLSLFVPGRLVGWLAFGITGIGFAWIKIDPALAPILGSLGLQARVDPSDLLALLSLLLAACLWRKAPFGPTIRLNWRLAALPLAALVTLADAAAPDMGVACLSTGDGSILATAVYYQGKYVSQDGGLSWQELEMQNTTNCTLQQDVPALKIADGSLLWATRGRGVERSVDEGKTWTTEFSLSGISEQEKTYFLITHSGNLDFRSGPYAAVIDPVTNNVVLAMGLEGVLVRNPSGQYAWVTVGPYQHDSLKEAGAMGLALLLGNQFWLAVLAALGWLFTRVVRQLGKGRVWATLGWIGLGVASIVAAPQVARDSYIGFASIVALLFMSAATVIALLVAGSRLKGTTLSLAGRALPQMVGMGLACLLPYVLWGVGIVPQYWMALAASAGVVIILLVVFSVGENVNPHEGAVRT